MPAPAADVATGALADVTAPAADDDIPPSRRVQLLDLTDKNCHWPLGDPRHPDFGFCNRRRIEGAPYCRAHAAVAYES
jgi:GcrA cell cycle regulator